jgi:hypothetical protein
MAIHPNKIDAITLRRLLDNLGTARVDVGDLEAVAQTLSTGSARVTAQVDDLLDDSAEARSAAYLRWADGDLDAAAIVALEHFNPAVGVGRDVASRMRRHGLAAVEDRATSAVRCLAGDLFETMRARDCELLDEVRTHAPAIEGIRTAAEAMASSRKVQTAWGTITHAVAARAALAEARRILGSVKALPTSRDLDEKRLAYRDPTVLADIPKGLDPVLRIVAEIEAGAGPGLYSVAEAEAGIAEDLASGYLVEHSRYAGDEIRTSRLPKGPRPHVSSVG